MTEVSYELPEIGEVSAAADPRTLAALVAIKAWINGTGTIGEAQLAAGIISKLNAKATGLESQKSIIATTEARSSPFYGTLATPDEVTIALPENGLIGVGYHATWKESALGAGRAGIFLGATQLVIGVPGHANPTAGAVPEASINAAGLGTEKYVPLSSSPATGLASMNGVASGTSEYAGDATTGQLLGGGLYNIGAEVLATGGPCYIFAAAGSYKISVQFRASSGVVTVKNRKLWAWVIS